MVGGQQATVEFLLYDRRDRARDHLPTGALSYDRRDRARDRKNQSTALTTGKYRYGNALLAKKDVQAS